MDLGLVASVRNEAIWILIVCSAVLVVGLLVAASVWVAVRRWIRAPSQDDEAADLWSLDDLQRLRDQGDMTEEEFQRLRARVIDAFSGGSSVSSDG